jgi:glycerol-3-phosphate acyltransferase PlsY
MPIFLIVVASYLLGSIPFGYLLVRIFHGEDVRQSGSGNIGATNVSRKSPILGVLTLILDAAKGYVAVALVSHLVLSGQRLQQMMAASALLAIVGHMFPIWLRFRGGKGVATALGAFLRISPTAILAGVVIFTLVVAVSRRVSLGSIITAALFPVVLWLMNASHDPLFIGLIALSSLLIVARHHQNIRRLLSGEEPGFSLKRK